MCRVLAKASGMLGGGEMCRDGKGHVGMRMGPGAHGGMYWENVSPCVCVFVWCVLILRLLKMSKTEKDVNNLLSEKSCIFSKIFLALNRIAAPNQPV